MKKRLCHTICIVLFLWLLPVPAFAAPLQEPLRSILSYLVIVLGVLVLVLQGIVNRKKKK